MARYNLFLDDQSAKLLDQVGKHKSRYLGEITNQRWRAAQAALGWLADEGWSHSMMRSAMAALSTTWEQGIGGCDPALPTRALQAAFPPETGDIDERICRALCVLAGEYWADNAALRAQLDDPPPRAVRKRAAGRAVTA